MILEELKDRWWKKLIEHNLEYETSIIKVRGLKPEEAIGRPDRVGYPLLKGREVMIQAEVRGAYGQAFTDEPSDYVGSLLSLYLMPLNTSGDRAILPVTRLEGQDINGKTSLPVRVLPCPEAVITSAISLPLAWLNNPRLGGFTDARQ